MSRAHGAGARAGGPCATLGPELGEELLEAAPDAIVVVDESGRIRRVNEQVDALFGYRRDELVGEPVELLVPGRFRDGHASKRSAYVAQPRRRPMGEGRELFARRKDGTEFPVDISLAPLRTTEGLFVLATVRDITDRKLAAEEAERRSAEAEALAEAARVVATGAAAGTTLQSILEAALRVLPARVAFLILPRDDETVLEIAAIAGAQERRLQRLPARHGVTGRAFRTGTVQAVSDVRTTRTTSRARGASDPSWPCRSSAVARSSACSTWRTTSRRASARARRA